MATGIFAAPSVEIVLDNKEANMRDITPTAVPILMYHGLDENHGQNATLFTEQMVYLAEHGYESISLDHLKSWIETGEPSLPLRPIIITFDDNYITVYDTAYPVMLQLRESGTKLFGYNFAHTYYVGVVTSFDHADWDECAEMEEAGILFTESHTVTHSNLAMLSTEDQRNELKQSKQAIDAALSKTTRHLAYPYGEYTEETINIAVEEGYETAVSTIEGLNTRSTPLYELRRYNITPNMGTGSSFTQAMNTDNNTSGWTSSVGVPDYYGTDYQYADAGAGEDKLTWIFPITIGGTYEVSARWTAHTNRATNAPYTIKHDEGSDTIRVDQSQNGGTWVSLGTYSFSASQTAAVGLSNDANGIVVADAIRLRLVESPLKHMWAIY